MLDVDKPSDGSLLLDPSVRIEGRMGIPEQTISINTSSLGSSEGTNVQLQPWGVVFVPVKYFGDEFDGNQLDTTRWEHVYTNREVTVANGEAYFYGKDIGYDYVFPLVRSLKAFPKASAGDWEAVYRMKYVNISTYYSIAFSSGITQIHDNPSASLMGTYGYQQGGNLYYYIMGNGTYSTYSMSESYHTYSLRYHSDDSTYSVYYDGNLKFEFYSEVYPQHFFFGSTYYSHHRNYNMTGACLDHARVWTFKGDWTSEVQDLGATLWVDGMTPVWDTNAKNKAEVRFQARTSLDGSRWTPWTSIVGGALPEPVECRYVMFRADLGLQYVVDDKKNITISGVELDVRYPIVEFAYNHDGSGWSPIEIDNSWSVNLTLNEDWNVIEFRVVDTNGSSNLTSITLLLDTTAPVGTFEIMVEGMYTNTRTIDLSLTASDTYGVTEIHVSLHHSFARYTRYDYSEMVRYELEGEDGNIVIYVRFVDSHGLFSKQVSDEIILDTTPPTGSVTINDDAQYTGTNNVVLYLDYWDSNGVALLVGSNFPGFAETVDLEVGTSEAHWDLGAVDDGVAWAYVRVQDRAGNSIVVNDSIEVYFPKALGLLDIENGAEVTNRSRVLVDIVVPEELRAWSMQMSNDAQFDDGEWMTVCQRTFWELTPGDGPKKVFIRFEDFRGIISLPVMDEIALDTTPPEVSVLVNLGAEYTIHTRVQLMIESQDLDKPTYMWISHTDDRTDAIRSPFIGMTSWDLPQIDGERTIHVWVSDKVWNIGHAVATIFYAAVPPTVEVYLPGGGVTSSDGSIPIQVDVTDKYGGTIEAQVVLDRDPMDSDRWQEVGPDMSISAGSLDEGGHTVRVRVRNVPGHVSDVVTASLLVDRTPPGVTVLFPVNGSKVTKEVLKVPLDLEVAESNSLTGLEYRVDGGDWVPFDLEDIPLEVKLSKYGSHTIEVRATDEAGHVSSTTTEFKWEAKGGTPGTGAPAVLVAIALVTILVTVPRGRSN